MSPAGGTTAVLIECVQHMLRPLLRFCVRHSLKLHELLEMVKIAYVRAADSELRASGAEVSASRLSVMTGVHRKDVTRILRDPGNFTPQENIVAKVMVQWQHNPKFRTRAGAPRVLEAEGKESEFAELVNSVNGGDLSAYALLYEMERMGVVERRGSTVRLVWRDFTPEPTVKNGLEMLASDTNDLYDAVEENIFHRQEIPNLHLRTVIDNVTPDAIPTIRRWLIEEGSLFHRRVRAFLAAFDRDLNPALRDAKGGVRVAFGTFSLVQKGRRDEG